MNDVSLGFEPNIEQGIFFRSMSNVFITSSWLFAFISFFALLSIWRVFSFTWTVVGIIVTAQSIVIVIDLRVSND